MASNIGVSIKFFHAMFPDVVQELMNKIINYILCLQQSVTPDPTGQIQTTIPLRPDLYIAIDSDRFPILPAMVLSGVIQRKHKLEHIIHTFLNLHYSKGIRVYF